MSTPPTSPRPSQPDVLRWKLSRTNSCCSAAVTCSSPAVSCNACLLWYVAVTWYPLLF
jgi:hypothetical protein